MYGRPLCLSVSSSFVCVWDVFCVVVQAWVTPAVGKNELQFFISSHEGESETVIFHLVWLMYLPDYFSSHPNKPLLLFIYFG